MMLITDPNIIGQIEFIITHFKTNITNWLMRPVLLHLPIDKQIWDEIDAFTNRDKQLEFQGIPLEELYRHLFSISTFVAAVRRDLPSVIRRCRSIEYSESDKVYRNMAVNNFSSNIKVLADQLNDLYCKAVELDKLYVEKDQQPLYLSVPAYQEIGKMLTGKPS
jgi:hypothetical protein